MMEKDRSRHVVVALSQLDRQQPARAEFKQHSAKTAAHTKQETDGPYRILVNHIRVHDEAHWIPR